MMYHTWTYILSPWTSRLRSFAKVAHVIANFTENQLCYCTKYICIHICIYNFYVFIHLEIGLPPRTDHPDAWPSWPFDHILPWPSAFPPVLGRLPHDSKTSSHRSQPNSRISKRSRGIGICLSVIKQGNGKPRWKWIFERFLMRTSCGHAGFSIAMLITLGWSFSWTNVCRFDRTKIIFVQGPCAHF